MKFVHQTILNLSVFFLFFINTVYAHTNSVGFSLSTNSSNSSTYDVEAFFGSWHTGTISSDGRAILYSLDPGGDSTLASDYNTIAYGDNDDTAGSNEFIFTRATTTSSITLNNENSSHTYTKSDITTAGFTPGTDYFWVDNSGDLMDTNVGAYGSVYNHQSAVVVGVAPGTYRLDYELPKPTVVTWLPVTGVDNVVFTISSDGSVVVAGAPGAISVSGNQNTLISLSNSDFISAFSGTLSNIKIVSLPSNGSAFIDSDSNGVSGPSELISIDQVITAADQDLLRYMPNNNYSGADVIGWKGYDTDAAAFSDSSGNVNITINDVTLPHIVGTTIAADNSTISVVFSEIVYTDTIANGNGALTIGDFDVTLSGGTALLTGYTLGSINVNTYTINLTLSGSANGSEVITVVPSSSTAIYDGSDNAASTSQSNNTVSLNSDALPSPLNKKDVVGSVEAWTGIVSRWANSSIDNVFNRIDWLRRHQDTTRTSHQGIKVHFKNKVIDKIMNATPKSKESALDNAQSNAVASLAGGQDCPRDDDHLTDDPLKDNTLCDEVHPGDTEGTLVSVKNIVTSELQNVIINEAARVREDAIGSLNPTFGPVVDNWSVWTEGKVLVGKKDTSSTASKQEIDTQSIAIGFDKPTSNNGLVGFVINIGQDNTDVGTDSTNVKSDNYSLSSYRVFGQGTSVLVESVIGLGHLEFDTVRTDGSDTLSGAREANQIFLSTALRRGNNINHSNWVLSPYTKLSLAHTRLNSFSESGGATALTFNKQSINDAKIRIGIDTNALIAINNNAIKPFGKIEYNASVSDTSAAMHYNSESTNYTSDLDKTNRNWRLEYGADYRTKDGWSSSASYMREQSIGSGETSQYSDSFRFNVGVGF